MGRLHCAVKRSVFMNIFCRSSRWASATDFRGYQGKVSRMMILFSQLCLGDPKKQMACDAALRKSVRKVLDPLLPAHRDIPEKRQKRHFLRLPLPRAD